MNRRTCGLAVLILALCGVAGRAEKSWFPRILTAEGAREHYLPDWSYAGYHWGEAPLPEHAPTLDVTDFGAVGDDGRDDTAAILAAVERAHDTEGLVVIRFPTGRFILREVIWIERGHFVLQGAGSGAGGTVIELPEPLATMNLEREAELFRKQKAFNDTTGREKYSPFSWTGGIIWSRFPGLSNEIFRERKPQLVLAEATAGKRGEHRVGLKPGHRLEAGRAYRLMLYNPADDSLLKHIHMNDEIEFGSWIRKVGVHFDVTVEAVDENVATLKEPLMHDLRPEWTPVFYELPALCEVGIEHLRFECPNRATYGGHHREAGYNVIDLQNVRHGWIRDVAVDNADTCIKLGGCSNVTVADCRFTDAIGSHYAVQLAMNCRCLVRDVYADTKAIHTFSFNTGDRGGVFTHVEVVRPRLDQHCGLNHQNLFDDIDVIEAEPGFALFLHGGGTEFFPLCGAFNTFWNVRLTFLNPKELKSPVEILGPGLPAPHARLVGFSANVPIELNRYGPDAYREGIGRPGIGVPSLYEYQLKRRVRRQAGSTPRVPSSHPQGSAE